MSLCQCLHINVHDCQKLQNDLKSVQNKHDKLASFTVQEIQEEGKHAIDSPGNPNNPIIPPEDYNLSENEQRVT